MGRFVSRKNLPRQARFSPAAPAIIAGFLLITACAVSRDPRAPATQEVARDAALQPLADVGAVRPQVAQDLTRILDAPYALPSRPVTCTELSFQIAKLDRILGPDFDVALPEDKNGDRAMRGVRLVGRMASGLLIPFRSIVREVSGAASAERAYRAALIAGIARRSYLKGIAATKECALPADPYAKSRMGSDSEIDQE